MPLQSEVRYSNLSVWKVQSTLRNDCCARKQHKPHKQHTHTRTNLLSPVGEVRKLAQAPNPIKRGHKHDLIMPSKSECTASTGAQKSQEKSNEYWIGGFLTH